MAKRIRDAELDEVSTVGVPANQHGLIVLTKSAYQEARVSDFFDAAGEPVDETTLEVGDVLTDADGRFFVWGPEEGADDLVAQTEAELQELLADEAELAEVGKSAAGVLRRAGGAVAHQARLVGPRAQVAAGKTGAATANAASRALNGASRTGRSAKDYAHAARHADDGSGAVRGLSTRRKVAIGTAAGAATAGAGGAAYANRDKFGKSFLEGLSEELSKAVTGADREELLLKSYADLAGRVEELVKVADGERDLRLEREYLELAKSYNVPGDQAELAAALRECGEVLSDGAQAVLHKALAGAGQMLFTEIGYAGEASNGGLLADLDAVISEKQSALAKAAGGKSAISKEAASTAFFDDNPEAYAEYLRDRQATGI